MTPTLTPWDEHNRTLVANVHPPGWVNPAPAARYNVVVVGAGTAGLVTAAVAAGLGARVALVERHLMGGDCLNVGCVPSKALLRAARAVADVRRAGDFGVRVPDGTHVDFAAVMERLRRVRAAMSPADSAARFRGLGVDVFLGAARFVGPDTVRVGEALLRFRRAVIATGARAVVPDIPGLAEASCLTNETVFDLTELPRRLAVIGGGPIGCELAQGFARLGAAVTLLDTASRILTREDVDVSACVERALTSDGVRLVLGSEIVSVQRGPAGERTLHVTSAQGAERLTADAIVVGAGRAPNVEDLGLAAAGVEFDARDGVRVDDRLRTSNRRIFAAGDVCSDHRFTHNSDAQARIVVRNALFFGRARASALTLPWCTYTDPEVAHVGLSARDAEARGIRVRTYVRALADVDRARLDGETDGFVKIHVRPGSDRIVGGTVVARHAGEIVSALTMAIAGRIGLARLANVIHPYPTQAEAIRALGDAYNRERLTPWTKRALRAWFAARR